MARNDQFQFMRQNRWGSFLLEKYPTCKQSFEMWELLVDHLFRSLRIWHLLKICAWNSKQPVFYGCFNWMIQNLYMGNGCFTKHPFINGCLEFQVGICLGILKDFRIRFVDTEKYCFTRRDTLTFRFYHKLLIVYPWIWICPRDCVIHFLPAQLDLAESGCVASRALWEMFYVEIVSHGLLQETKMTISQQKNISEISE